MNDCAEEILTRLLDLEKADTSGIESRRRYLSMHKARFAAILQLSRTLVPDCTARVLDVGRSELTANLATFYRDIRTLGFDPCTDDGGHRENRHLNAIPHIVFDLLQTTSVASWPQCGMFDLIVFSEVIEHLHVAPAYVLAFLGSLLSPHGVLICTTPNAVSFYKRMRMLTGHNPYERLRLYSQNPGHIREYTRGELITLASEVRLDCSSHFYSDWIYREGRPLLKKALLRFLNVYPPFRPLQTFVFSRSDNRTTRP